MHVPDPIVSRADGLDPEHEALLADSVGLALLVVLETLAPAERLAFVLHDISPCPSTRSPLSWGAPRPRRGSSPAARAAGCAEVSPPPTPILTRQREVVDAFLAASREGDFEALLAVLDPDVVLRTDGGDVRAGLSREVRGAHAVAEQTLTFSRLSPFVRPALVNGAAGSRRGPAWTAVCGHGLHGQAAGRSSRSTSSPTPRVCASSTWRSSTTTRPCSPSTHTRRLWPSPAARWVPWFPGEKKCLAELSATSIGTLTPGSCGGGFKW